MIYCTFLFLVRLLFTVADIHGQIFLWLQNNNERNYHFGFFFCPFGDRCSVVVGDPWLVGKSVDESGFTCGPERGAGVTANSPFKKWMKRDRRLPCPFSLRLMSPPSPLLPPHRRRTVDSARSFLPPSFLPLLWRWTQQPFWVLVIPYARRPMLSCRWLVTPE